MLSIRSHSIAAVAAFFAAFMCVANATSIGFAAPAPHSVSASI